MAKCPNCRTNINEEIVESISDYRDEIKENLVQLIHNEKIELNIEQDEFINYVLFGK